MHHDDARAIVECVEWARKRGLKLILRGAREGWKIAEYLAKRKVPVVVGPVMSSPRGRNEPWDSVYRNPAALQKAGVLFAIEGDLPDSVNDAPQAQYHSVSEGHFEAIGAKRKMRSRPPMTPSLMAVE